MQFLRLFFSSAGRLQPKAFIGSLLAVYAAGLLSQALTMPLVSSRVTLLPFLFVQAVVMRAWYAVHVKRLRDAGRGIGWPVTAIVCYALAVIVFVVAAILIGYLAGDSAKSDSTNLLSILLVLAIASMLYGSIPDFGGLLWFVVGLLSMIALLPLALTIGCSIFAATRPSAPA